MVENKLLTDNSCGLKSNPKEWLLEAIEKEHLHCFEYSELQTLNRFAIVRSEKSKKCKYRLVVLK